MGTMPTMKIANLMELPSVVLIGGLFANGTGEIHYPPPLLKLSIRSAQPPQNSPSGQIILMVSLEILLTGRIKVFIFYIAL